MNGNAHVRTVIDELVRRLIASYVPEKVVLFGSYAYGQPHPDSDLDLLVVKDTPEPFPARLDAVRKAVAGAHPRIPFEPVVLTPTEVQQRLAKGDQYLGEILSRGEVLYAR